MPLATNSLERALVLLQHISRTPGGSTNLEISRHFGIARSTCSYILSRLEKEGYLARDKDTGRYRIGLKNLVLGRGALREAGFRSATEPTLYRLAMETGLAANLAVLEANRVIILDRVEGPAFIKAAVEHSDARNQATNPLASAYSERGARDVGSEVPVYTTAVGRVLLAHLPQPQLENFIRRWPPKGTGPKKIATQDLLSELRRVQEQGYYLMRFEPHNESCALAAPIFDATETAKAAVSVSCRRHLPVWNDEQALSELVKEAAWEISSRLHYPRVVPPQVRRADSPFHA
jgi:DNA-binding IclR family transcriptional regulator